MTPGGVLEIYCCKSLNSPVSRISLDLFADRVADALYGGDLVGGDVLDGGREFFEGEGGDGI